MNGFKVESIFTRCASTVDKGLSLGFHTKELSVEEKAMVMDLHNQTGWLVFSPNEVPDTDIPSVPAETGSKTPSQRLRAVLYVAYEQSEEKGKIDFELYYRNRVEMIIDKIKERLDK